MSTVDRSIKHEYSPDGFATVGTIEFNYVASTFKVDGSVVGNISDLNSLVDTLTEFEAEIANGTSDPTDLSKRTAGGIVVVLNPDATPAPTLGLAGWAARPADVQLALRDTLKNKLGYPGSAP